MTQHALESEVDQKTDLLRLSSHLSFWFGWFTYHLDTELLGERGKPSLNGSQRRQGQLSGDVVEPLDDLAMKGNSVFAATLLFLMLRESRI